MKRSLTKTTAPPSLPQAVIHVDLDGAQHIYQGKGWPYDHREDTLFESGLINLLSFLSHHDIRATLFTIAEDLDNPRKHDLLQEAVQQGHEIASHSLTHSRLARLTREEKRVEIAESRARLEKAFGIPVTGFRAPSYDVDRACLDLLDEYGYRYDSSVFPTPEFASRLQVLDIPGAPHRPFFDRSLMELPLPSYKPGPFPFHPCYSLILGRRYFKSRLLRFRQTELPLVMLFHLTDMAAPMPRERLPNWRARLLTLSHLSAETKESRCQMMLEEVKKHYEITDTDTLLAKQPDVSSQATLCSSP